MLEKIIERVKLLNLEIEKSAANHNALMGRMLEAKELLDELSKAEEKIPEAALESEVVI